MPMTMDAPNARVPDQAQDATPGQPTATILLVEDDADVRETTAELLAMFGHRVLTADSESQARWLWERHRPAIDLLVSDMMLPTRATGSSLARQFLREKPELRVLLVSGFGPEIGEEDPDFPDEAVFLQKPYQTEVFRDLIFWLISQPRS